MRTDDDSWDVTQSVGSTALQIALGRMAETASAAPLFSDPFAAYFVEAATELGWRPAFDAERLAQLTAADPRAMDRLLAMGSYVAVRTKFFDDFFLHAGEEGIDQVVILAAGLDSRAWRLAWPNAATVYEIDLPDVLDFKLQTLRAHNAEPATGYVSVPTDLRHDWPDALRGAGFDPSRRTAWSAEGLLLYLPAAGQDLLLDRVGSLSARDSLIAVEAYRDGFFDAESPIHATPGISAIHQASVKAGERVEGTPELFYLEKHADVADWLTANGWAVNSIEALAVMDRYGRPAAADVADAVVDSAFVHGRRL